MSGAKIAGLVVLGLVLFGVVGAANVVTTAERTALNGEYVTERIDSTGSYEAIRNATVNGVVDRVEDANLSEGQQLLASNDTDTRTLVEDAVTEEYIREQASGNIRSLYDYLHGRQSSLGMEIDLRPLKDNLATSFADQIDGKNTSTLVNEFGPGESQTPVPVDGDLVRQMRSGPQGYEQARLDFRVDIGFQVSGTDEKLLLIGENPREYTEQEKERIVENREGEIRDALRQEIRDQTSDLSQRVRQEVQQRRADAKDEICDSTVQELDPDSGQQVCAVTYQDSSDTTHLDNVTRAAVELQYVVVDGLTREQSRYGYQQFDADLTDSEDHLTNETSDLAAARIEGEVPDTLSAQEQFGEDAITTFEDAQGAVGLIDTVYLVLPIVALLLIAVAYGITRSLETTATFTGIVLTLTGGLHLIVATALGSVVLSRVEAAIENAGTEQFGDIAVTVVEGVLGALTTQSAALLVAGIVLLALSYASKSGVLGSSDTQVAGSAGAGGQPRQQSRQPSTPGQSQGGRQSGNERQEKGESGHHGEQNRGGQN